MNSIVRHIIIYSAGLISGVLLTILVVKILGTEERIVEKPIATGLPREIVKRDTVEKVVYKKPVKADKETSTSKEDTMGVLPIDTLIYDGDSTKVENINREVLIAVKNYPVLMFSKDTNDNALIDSLEKSMGIRVDENSLMVRVEFWKSPLNFEGYILGKNLVRLYGISELEPLVFYELDRKLYMKKNNDFFTLIRSEEYHKFELSKEAIDDKLLQISGNG